MERLLPAQSSVTEDSAWLGCVLASEPQRHEAPPAEGFVRVESFESLADLLGRGQNCQVLVLHNALGFAAWLFAHRRSPQRITTPTLLCDATDARTLPLFDAVFAHAAPRPQVLLATPDLLSVLRADDRHDLCIGGTVLHESQTIILMRGDLSPLIVPFSAFAPTPAGPAPDFSDFEVIDWGRTLRFGAYEAAFDAVLYEHDPDYRKRIRAHMRAEDQGLGSSIRRLRLQRGLRQDDFGDVPARTIARIENGEVATPRQATLAAIARVLGTTVEGLAGW